MTLLDFVFYKEFFSQHSGICLTPDKIPFLEHRLNRVAVENDFTSLEALTAILRDGKASDELIANVVLALSFSEPAAVKQ